MNKSLAVSSSILFLIVISLMIHFISKGLPAENHSGNAEAADILQNQANVISKYNTPYSIGYQKSGYRQLYFFASPVRYQDNEKHYHTINSTIASDSQDGYADMVKKSFASNYISLQQKNKRMVIHMPPKVGMVQTNSIVHHDTISAYQYSDEKMDYYCHSSNSGIVVEADVKGDQNACRLWLDIPDSEIIHNGQYVRLIQEDGKEILISFPLCYAEESGDYYLNNTVQITKEENGYTLQLNPDEQAQGQQKVKMVFSIHYYVEKVMYDSPINEKNSTLNQIYQEYTAIGRHSGQEYGTLLRFDFKNITPKDADHLISAKYYFKVIGGDADNMSLSLGHG